MNTAEILEKDRKYIWHPFTQHKDYENKDHVVIERGEGVFLFDSEGNKYYDTISSWWVNMHGHNNTRIKKAISDQMEKIEHVNFSGFTHRPAVELAEKIINLMPKPLSKLFYSDNGSTAVEIALKMSFQYWKNIGVKGKNKFIYLENGYHGDTVGAVSVGGVELFHEIYKPLLFTSHRAESPNCLNCKYGKQQENCSLECLEMVRKMMQEKGNEISGFIIEPMVQAAGGLIFHSERYLKEIRKITKENNIHLILDEVATGFGRTGKMWAMEHSGIVPDFIAVSKGISAGYMALAATITNDEIYNAFFDDYNKNKTFFHGHSYTANPLACAAGVESLNIFEDEKIIENIGDKSKKLKEKMKTFEKFGNVKNIRVLGLIAAMDIVSDEKGVVFNKSDRIAEKIYDEGFRRGLVLRPIGDTVYYFLQHCVTENDINEIVERTEDVLKIILKQSIESKRFM